MMRSVVITGADRGLGLALCERFAQKGWSVYAGRFLDNWGQLDELQERYPNRLWMRRLDVGSMDSVTDFVQSLPVENVDMLISNAGIATGMQNCMDEVNVEETLNAYNVNALGALRITRRLLEKMHPQGMRRLCYVSSESGSITLCRRKQMYGYCMSKAALNMCVRILHNDLYPKGFTFRLYQPGWMRSYMNGEKCLFAEIEPEESASAAYICFTSDRWDEERLTLVDYRGKELVF